MRIRLLLAGAVALIWAVQGAWAQDLKIGFISTFSTGAAALGKHQRDGWDLALEHLGGKIGGLDTEIIYGDDQVKADVGRQVADKMLQRDRVHFIAGVVWSHVLMAIAQPVTRSETFLISTNAGASPLAGEQCSPYFFSTSWQNDGFSEALGKVLQDRGAKNLFLMAPNYQAGKDNMSGLQRFYKGSVKGQLLTALNQTDYQAEISQIRALDPEGLVIFLPAQMGVAFIKQWAASGLAGRIPLYTTFTVNYLTLPALGEAAKGAFTTSYWGPDLDNPANQKFVKAFIEKYGYTPSHFSAQAYDAPFLIDSGIRAVNGDLSNKKGIIAAMRKADYASVRGRYTYNTNHFPIQDYYYQEVVDGPAGEPILVTRDVVMKAHGDAYAKDCKMPF